MLRYKRGDKKAHLNGTKPERATAAHRRYREVKPYPADVRWSTSPRHRAHSLAVKYGLKLKEIEAIGLDFFPDVQEALSGNHQA